MASYDLGDVVALSCTIQDSDGDLADATAVVCTITLPDGTTATPTVQHPSLGTYTTTYTPAAVGQFLVRWVATGTNASAFADVFSITDGSDLLTDASRLLVTVQDLGDVADEAAALSACELASALVTDYLGQSVLVESYDHTVPVHADVVTRDTAPTGVVGVLDLPARPVVSVDSVTVDGVALDDDQWVWDVTRGQVLTDDPGAYSADVAYDAGYTAVPAGLRAVARRLALSLIANPAGVRSEQAGDYSVSFNGTDFTALERRVLDRYRPSVGTIRAR